MYFQEEPVIIEIEWKLRHFPGRVARELLDQVAEHREALWTEWSAKVGANDD